MSFRKLASSNLDHIMKNRSGLATIRRGHACGVEAGAGIFLGRVCASATKKIIASASKLRLRAVYPFAENDLPNPNTEYIVGPDRSKRLPTKTSSDASSHRLPAIK